ncbi:MAG: 3-phosphoshikimate 1-carboxyvinyltransferase, partial [Myxococcota bacterium]
MEPAGPLVGATAVPGDKSVSHRAVLLNTLATGEARIRGLSTGEDVAATVAACRALGATITPESDGDPGCWRIVAPDRLAEPDRVLDCGNSGTSIRLLLGALAPGPGLAVLTGDDSLRRRPMDRVVEPLRAMGASIDGRDGGRRAPLAVRGRPLAACDHDLPIASAQLKSALLLAGLGCGVRIREPRPSRDHTERMLRAMGARLTEHRDDRLTPGEADGPPWLSLAPGPLRAVDVDVPGDLSAAAFLLVAGAIVPGSTVTITGVGVNPTRTGVIDVLRAMGADLEVIPRPSAGGEPLADLVVRASPLRGVEIAGTLALRSLDELVVLAIAAATADGTTTVRDAAELRVKESDRIALVAETGPDFAALFCGCIYAGAWPVPLPL